MNVKIRTKISGADREISVRLESDGDAQRAATLADELTTHLVDLLVAHGYSTTYIDHGQEVTVTQAMAVV